MLVYENGLFRTSTYLCIEPNKHPAYKGRFIYHYLDTKEELDEFIKSEHFYGYNYIFMYTPTEEQLERLNKINNLELENKAAFIQEFTLYVEHGIVTTDKLELHDLYKESEAATKAFLINHIKPIVKLLRDTTINNGFNLFGYNFDANQAAITHAVAYITLYLKDKELGKDVSKRVYHWKDKDNIYRTLTFEQLSQLADGLSVHIQGAFGTEDTVLNKLEELPIYSLLTIEENKKYDLYGYHPEDIQKIDLEAIYSSAFEQVTQYLKSQL